VKNEQKRFRNITATLAGTLLLLVVISLAFSPFLPPALQAGYIERSPELSAAPLLQPEGEPPPPAPLRPKKPSGGAYKCR